ncbi:FecR domain-containing protein [Pseudomonas sp. SIMBA_077]
MSPSQPTNIDSIDAQAARWFTRNRAPHSEQTEQQFQAWYAHPTHAQAYSEFEALWADLGELEPLNAPAPLPTQKPARKPYVFALATAAAIICAVFTLNLGAPVALYQTQVATHDQGVHTLHLPDGSTLNVNANTQLRIEFTPHARTVYLDQGQFYIEVAANKEQPLVVQAGEAQIKVVGTGFDVRRSQRQLAVSVAHGNVAFMPNARTSTLLGAQQQATYHYAKRSLQEHTLSANEVGNWRTGHLSFRQRDLASLVDELNLYRPGVVELASGPLEHYKVSGNLNTADPLALVKALPALIPVKTVLLDSGKIRIEPR